MTDVAVTATQYESATLARQIPASLFDPDRDFDAIIAAAGADAFYSRGFRKVSKEMLVGVPHIVIGVTYRPGYKNPDTGVTGDYVSCEAIVASQNILEALPIASAIRAIRRDHNLTEELEVYANEAVVYNDGGTGVRRTLTDTFNAVSMIEVGPPRKKDENPLDKPMSLWLNGEDRAAAGFVSIPNAEGEVKPFVYVATRGLRFSEYSNEYTGKETARTFYFN